jgi:hypothetical protein
VPANPFTLVTITSTTPLLLSATVGVAEEMDREKSVIEYVMVIVCTNPTPRPVT